MRCPKCEADFPTADEFTVHLLQEVLLSLVNEQTPMTYLLGFFCSTIRMKVVYDLMQWKGMDFETACLTYLRGGDEFNRILDKFNAEHKQIDEEKHRVE